jgi:ribonuclease VapC
LIVAVDASALVAVARAEPDRADILGALAKYELAFATPVNLFEASLILVHRHAVFTPEQFRQWISALKIETAHVVEHEHALDAFLRYGKGVHRAGLNLGDCFAYALAKALDAPLLFKGEDFIFTDVKPALQPI